MNRPKLMEAIKQKGYTVTAFCTAAGMSRSTFYRKLNGTGDFTRGEMERITKVLAPASPMALFFAPKVS